MNGRTSILVVVALLALSPVAAAGTRAAFYFAGVPLAGAGVQCNTACVPNGPEINVGGYEFDADGSTPVDAFVYDEFGDGAFIVACQDVDDDGFCGSTGEPSATGCGTHVKLEGFSPGLPTSIFVYAFDRASGCQGLVTQGTIVLVSR